MNTANTYQLITITGADSETFLQGQLTCDLRDLNPGDCRLGAHCDHKGRAISSFFVLKPPANAADFWVVLPSDMTNVFCEHLGKYAVFSKVSIAPNEDLQVICLLADADHAAADCNLFTLPGEPLRYFCIAPQTSTIKGVEPPDWQWAQWQAGLCLITQPLSGKLIPLMMNYDQLGGVSLDKGCYLGQEVLARMHFRGQLKRHLHQLTLTAPASIGDDITNEQQTVGIVTAIATNPEGQPVALAVIRDAAIEHPLLINQQQATMIR